MNKLDQICYFVETLVDDFSTTKRKPRASFFKYLESENVDRNTITKFVNERSFTIKDQLEELDEVLEGKDDDLREAYSNFRKPEIRDFRNMLEDILSDASKYKDSKNIVRKPKKKTPEQLVKGLNILESSVMIEGKTYAPVPKTDIIGSCYAIFYNVKSQDLVFFSGKKLSCSGAKIIDFDIETSGTKRLKNPSADLDLIINSSKINIKTVLESLPNKCKPTPKTVSKNLVLLKVIK